MLYKPYTFSVLVPFVAVVGNVTQIVFLLLTTKFQNLSVNKFVAAIQLVVVQSSSNNELVFSTVE